MDILRVYLTLSLAAALPGCAIVLALCFVVWSQVRKIDLRLDALEHKIGLSVDMQLAWKRHWGDDAGTRAALDDVVSKWEGS